MLCELGWPFGNPGPSHCKENPIPCRVLPTVLGFARARPKARLVEIMGTLGQVS
jgi:hypothetical protein